MAMQLLRFLLVTLQAALRLWKSCVFCSFLEYRDAIRYVFLPPPQYLVLATTMSGNCARWLTIFQATAALQWASVEVSVVVAGHRLYRNACGEARVILSLARGGRHLEHGIGCPRQKRAEYGVQPSFQWLEPMANLRCPWMRSQL